MTETRPLEERISHYEKLRNNPDFDYVNVHFVDDLIARIAQLEQERAELVRALVIIQDSCDVGKEGEKVIDVAFSFLKFTTA